MTMTHQLAKITLNSDDETVQLNKDLITRFYGKIICGLVCLLMAENRNWCQRVVEGGETPGVHVL